jgi:hypothetical protein
MTLSPDLQRILDALNDRVREEMGRQLAAVREELARSIEAGRRDAVERAMEAARADATTAARQQFDERLDEALAEASRQHQQRQEQALADAGARADEARRDGFVAGREEGLKIGWEDGLREGKDESFREHARLVDALRRFDAGRSLTEVLDTLAESAAAEAGRAIVFLVTGSQLKAFRRYGFADEGDTDLELAIGESGVLGAALRGTMPVNAGSDDEDAPRFAALPPGRRLMAVPLGVGGETVAVLYADEGAAGDARAGWQASVEAIARHAARSLEVITAFRAAEALAGAGQPLEN